MLFYRHGPAWGAWRLRMMGKKATPQQEIMRLLQKAGHTAPTPLQEKVFPPILAGRDIAIEAGPGSGRIASFVLPLLASGRRDRHASHVLVLASDAERVKEIGAEFARFSRLMTSPPTIVCLGDLDDARKELRRLEKPSEIVVGTTERIIDHIRRGNLPFDAVKVLVIDQPEGDDREDFDKDVPFILAKISRNRQTVLLCSHLSKDHNLLLPFLKRPQFVYAAELFDSRGGTPGFSWFESAVQDRVGLLKALLPLRSVGTALIVCGSARVGEKLAQGIGSPALPAGNFREETGSLTGHKLLAEMQARNLRLLCIPHQVLHGADLAGISHVIFHDLPDGSVESLRKLLRESLKGKETIFLVSKSQMRKFITLQESTGVTIQKDDLPSDDERIRRLIDGILESLHTADPKELSRIRALFRRKVPLHRRSWFTACLLASQVSPAVPKVPGKAAPRSGRQLEKKAGFTRLFVNAGRNRRLWPKDFVALFTEKLGVRKEDLGDIKVFDKYSFVEIVDGKAAAAISTLGGTEFKGKPLVIDYAKKREEKPTRELR
jgi:ATP-dependent RNA helicase DeaD